MWLSKGFEYVKPATYTRRKSPFIDRDFQVRYTLLLIGASALGVVLVIGPIYYFVNQNYRIFVELAYDHAPGMLKYLEQERIWINTILFGVFAGLLMFFSHLGVKMTARIVGPLKVLSNHLKQLSRGHWYINPIKVRSNDEFLDLIESYNYFFKSFQANLHKDLERIKQLPVDPNNRDAYILWKELVDEKSAQLNILDEKAAPLFAIVNDEGAAAPRGSRHAS